MRHLALLLFILAQTFAAHTSSPPASQPRLYLFFGSPMSEKFNQQYRLLSADPKSLSNDHVLIVPVTNVALTTGWPVGITVRTVDGVTQDALRRRYGWQEGKQEFILVLVDCQGRVKLRSLDPVPIDSLHAALFPRRPH